MNALRVPYEAHTSVVGYASEGSAYEACGGDTPACRNALQLADTGFSLWVLHTQFAGGKRWF
jgi:hypothetical protein